MKLSFRFGFLGYLVSSLVAVSACERQSFTLSDDVPINNNGASSFGGSNFGGSTPIPIAGTAPQNPCQLDGNKPSVPTFGDQTVRDVVPARKVLYALVTDDEVKALRKGGPLIPPPVASAPETTLELLLNSVRTSASQQRRALGELLRSRFSSWRSTWPNPWALRLVDHPGSEHMNMVRIVLRDEALVVRITQGSPVVVTVDNMPVSIDVANAQPERIAAIFYQLDNSQPISSTIDRCENGMREIALGSEAMVEEWSLATSDILERLNGDIDLLQAFFEITRQCTGFERSPTFRSFTVCQTWSSFSSATEYLAYQWALSTPVEAYKPSPQNLASLIQALQDDRFEPDQFIVRPDPPPGIAAGGAGGDTGAGGEGSLAGAPSEGGAGQGGAGQGGAG